jgi:hypothetical protein
MLNSVASFHVADIGPNATNLIQNVASKTNVSEKTVNTLMTPPPLQQI